MIGRDQVMKVLGRLLSSGPIDHLPRKFSDTELLMALAASSFNAKQEYSEKEVNDHLVDWLKGFTDPTGLDHVTVRRYLIDLKFFLRNPSGSSYWMNEAVIALVLEPEARTVHPCDVLAEVQRQREERKRSNE
ncbi:MULTISPECIES: DUF2087 domain-containing protein [Cyanophyceae]|uniref:DUF2087 domain-containing protein n=2 Tax=Cyanobacteriota TaxID=1117 RepID=UPI001687EDEC|nr:MULTISPECIES: DUF2087 domain-containing protein [unclassified Phormidium]MBD1917970.1 DUF2087 domain-containing protein [Phormidium sp. FACHB-77]MBD2029218.1 DUF2087 domain-containing protein [Phormidium sp. FACHB-322]MBD2049750.1 DUF2087 domain-containing protein [Leptolyngbya sp. FACHB-60]